MLTLCIGYYRKPIVSNGQQITNFACQTHPGIALGHSNYSNAMLFYDPMTKMFITLADYKLDSKRKLPDVYPHLKYDGVFVSKKLSDNQTPKEPFPPGAHVFAQVGDEFYNGVVFAVPTHSTPWYQVCPLVGGNVFAVDLLHLYGPDDPIYPANRYQDNPTDRPLPKWIKPNGKVTLIIESVARPETLRLNDKNQWEFVQRSGRDSLITFQRALSNLPSTWKERLLEGLLTKGWPTLFVPSASAYHVHADGLQKGVPSSF